MSTLRPMYTTYTTFMGSPAPESRRSVGQGGAANSGPRSSLLSPQRIVVEAAWRRTQGGEDDASGRPSAQRNPYQEAGGWYICGGLLETCLLISGHGGSNRLCDHSRGQRT